MAEVRGLDGQAFYPAYMWGGPLCFSCASGQPGHEAFPRYPAPMAWQHGACVGCRRWFPEPRPSDIDVGEPSWEGRVSGADILDYCQRLHLNAEDWDEGDLEERVCANRHYRKTTLRIADIDCPWGVDERLAAEYAALPGRLPSIVCGPRRKVIDGTHRVAAARMRGDTVIDAFVADRRA